MPGLEKATPERHCATENSSESIARKILFCAFNYLSPEDPAQSMKIEPGNSQSIERTISSMVPLSVQTKVGENAKHLNWGEVEEKPGEKVPASQRRDQEALTGKIEPELATAALRSFKAFDRDRNEYLSQSELENPDRIESWRFPELEAAKFMSKNFYELESMTIEPPSIWSLCHQTGISKDDLQTLAKVTAPDFNPVTNAARDAADANGPGLWFATSWGFAAFFSAKARNPLLATGFTISTAAHLLKPMTDFYKNWKKYDSAEELRKKMIPPRKPGSL